MAKLKKATRKPTDWLKPTARMKKEGNPEVNFPAEADGNAEKQGTLQLTIQLKPMAKLKKNNPEGDGLVEADGKNEKKRKHRSKLSR